MRVRIGNVVSAAVLGLMLVGSAGVMRADTVFSNFGPGQTYQGASWWNVGNSTSPAGTQVAAFSFVPTATASVTGATLPLALVPPPGSAQTVTPLTVYIESNAAGMPGSILATLTQTGSYSNYPTTSLVNFACTGSCATLDAGTTYWMVGQQTDPANTTGWFWSPSDTGTWYFNEADSATGPWTVATAGDNYAAFDVTGTVGTGGTSPTPEPASLTLLGTGLLALAGIAWSRRASRQRSPLAITAGGR
jgi:hypothetical protein